MYGEGLVPREDDALKQLLYQNIKFIKNLKGVFKAEETGLQVEIQPEFVRVDDLIAMR